MQTWKDVWWVLIMGPICYLLFLIMHNNIEDIILNIGLQGKVVYEWIYSIYVIFLSTCNMTSIAPMTQLHRAMMRRPLGRPPQKVKVDLWACWREHRGETTRASSTNYSTSGTCGCSWESPPSSQWGERLPRCVTSFKHATMYCNTHVGLYIHRQFIQCSFEQLQNFL